MAMDKVSACVLVVVCFFSVTSAFNTDRVQTMTNDDESPDIAVDSDQVDEVMETLQKLQQLFDAMAEKENGGSCRCRGLTCDCCVEVKVKKFRAKLCLVLSINPRAGSASISVTVAGKRVFRKTFSFRRIPALCFNYKIAKFCLEFYDVRVDSRSAKGCARVSVKILGKRFKIKVGCFHVNFLNSSVPFPFSGIQMEEAENEIENSDGDLYVETESIAEDGQTIDEDTYEI